MRRWRDARVRSYRARRTVIAPFRPPRRVAKPRRESSCSSRHRSVAPDRRRRVRAYDPNINTRNRTLSDRLSTLVEKRRVMASRRALRNESAFVYALTALAVALIAVGASGAYTHTDDSRVRTRGAYGEAASTDWTNQGLSMRELPRYSQYDNQIMIPFNLPRFQSALTTRHVNAHYAGSRYQACTMRRGTS